ASAESTTNNQQSSAQQEFHGETTDKEHTDAETTELQTKITTATKTSVRQAWQSLKSSKKANATELSGSADVAISGATSADLVAKDFTIDLGKLLAIALAEDPPLAFIIAKAVGKVTLDGKVHTELSGSFKSNVAGKTSWSEEEEEKSLSLYDKQVETTV